MQEKELRLGDLVEVTYGKKIAGYLFSMDDDKIVLCNSPEFIHENQLISVRTADVLDLFHFERPAISKPSPHSPTRKGNVIPFRIPGKSEEDPA